MGQTPDNGGPAFPACNEANVNETMGMTLRDYFAGQVINGLMSVEDQVLKIEDGETAERAVIRYWRERATFSYFVADAMLAARKGGA